MMQLKLMDLVSALLVGFLVAPSAVADAPTASSTYVIRYDHWSAEDERGFAQFIQAIGESDCGTLDACLHSPANPFRGSDPEGMRFESDCAQLPYVLRFYYAWKRGLPFSYVSAVSSVNGENDIRYSRSGNKVESRTDVPGGVLSGYEIIRRIRDAVSSATYRTHPDKDGPLPPDFYSPRIDRASVGPGTVVYDPAGHVAIVYRVDADGRAHLFDAHTDFSLTQMVFDVRFARTSPAQGAGFKNWRPIKLVGAKTQADGTLRGGRVEAASNALLADFSDEQYYGTGARPADADWANGSFTVGTQPLNYYDFVRARLAGGRLVFDPVKEVHEMTWAICTDLYYRSLAVDLANRAGIADQRHPDRLPPNIYGTGGDWEMYSTPSRDARLKTEFKALRDSVQRFVEMDQRHDTEHLSYNGSDLVGDLLKTYGQVERFCVIDYHRSDGSTVRISYEEARKRLFAMSFDPYHCPELRWGARESAELTTCRDDVIKRFWYDSEQGLRNQIDRTYDARMDFSLADLQKQSPNPPPPDTDVRGYLESTGKLARN
jgi:hypothetical protein